MSAVLNRLQEKVDALEKERDGLKAAMQNLREEFLTDIRERDAALSATVKERDTLRARVEKLVEALETIRFGTSQTHEHASIIAAKALDAHRKEHGP